MATVEAFDGRKAELTPAGSNGAIFRVALFALLGCVAGFEAARWLHFDGRYRFDYDEGVYLACGALARGSAIFSQVFSSQPPLLLEVLKHFVQGGAHDVLVARGFIAACAFGTLVATVWLAQRRSGWLAAIGALIFLATSFRWQMQSRTVQAEFPALVCVSIAVALATLRRRRGFASAAAGVAFALAVLFKLLALPFAPGLLWLVATDRADAAPGSAAAHSTRAARVLIFLGAVALTWVAICLRYDLSALEQQMFQFHLGARTAAPPPWDWLRLTLEEDLFFWLGALAAIAILAGARQRELLRDLLLLAVPPFLCMLWNRPFFPHHLIVLAPAVALLEGAALAICLERLAQRKMAGVIAATALFAVVIGARITALARASRELELALLNDDDLRAVARLEQLLAPGDQLVTDDQFLGFLARRLPPPALCDTSSVRMNSLRSGDALIEGSGAARAVMFWTNRLNTSPAFVRWTEQRFPRREELGPDRWIAWRAAEQ